ncbi:MAG: DNA repair protein RecO [Calditrichaeota bacterium]|nr:MAG: DNA repair protein RecO [Calditrichota bacterium]
MSVPVRTLALVLHTRRWSESSKIVELFTRQRGNLKLMAKGALRPKSPFAGVVESLNYVEVLFTVRETRSLQVLTSASLINPFLHIRENWNKTAVAFAAAELIAQALRQHEPVPAFFDYTIQWFTHLDRAGGQQFLDFLIHFLLELNRTLGFALNPEQCWACHQPPRGKRIYLIYQNGAFLCQTCFRPGNFQGEWLNREAWQHLETVSRKSLAQLDEATHPISPTELDIIRALLQFLRFHVEFPIHIKSLTWLA